MLCYNHLDRYSTKREEILRMRIEYWYIFSAILGAISIFGVIFCIVRGKGALHKILVSLSSMLGVVVIVCFGGEVVLNLFGMGWRCAPFNIMLMLCAILSIIILGCCTGEFIRINHANKVLTGCGCTSMVLLVFVILMSAFIYFPLASWHDGLTSYNNQTIVYANNCNGGSGNWCYYTHINDVVHGIEITQDGWRGYPPFRS